MKKLIFFLCYHVIRSVFSCCSNGGVEIFCSARQEFTGWGWGCNPRQKSAGWLIQQKLVGEGIHVSAWGDGVGWMSLIHVRVKDGQHDSKVQTANDPKDTGWGLGWGL